MIYKDGKSLEDEMISKKVSIMTTSHDFVLIKNGTEIASPMNCIITPNERFTCRIMKYAVTTRNDPTILPMVSIFISNHLCLIISSKHSPMESQNPVT